MSRAYTTYVTNVKHNALINNVDRKHERVTLESKLWVAVAVAFVLSFVACNAAIVVAVMLIR
jgi:hypothetical protein